MKKRLDSTQSGLTLIETLVGSAILMLVAVSIWQGFAKTLEGIAVLRTKNAVTTMANELFEITRNMPYEDIGIVNGLPPGEIPKTRIIEKDGRQFQITTSVINVDLPFDGVIGGEPNDLAPADNKLVEYLIECFNCDDIDPLTVTSRVAPRNLETTGDNGALFVQVLNANGDPVQGADVTIENYDADPFFIVEETTNNDGMFQLIDAPPGTEVYEIFVSKDGYTSGQTYLPGEPANPVPDKPHANVSTGLVTQITFYIDEVSEINFNTRRINCSPVGGLDFEFYGEKTIGEEVLKYGKSLTTNGSGKVSLDDVEWDTYHLDITDPSFFLAGANPFVPISISPGASYDLDLIVESKDPNALLIKVVDDEGLPIADASVEISSGSFSETQETGRGSMSQIDWSGGSGQDQIGDDTRFYSQDGNINVTNNPGEISLEDLEGIFTASGELISSTFDTGTTTNFHVFNWKPQSQLPQTGTDSAKFQVATNEVVTATTTWSFIGPDGTGSSYFTTSGEPFSSTHNDDRYLRYKLFLSTEDNTASPVISDISFSFTTGCAPSGQVYFDGLDSGEYELRVTKSGYEDFYSGAISVSQNWQDLEVVLTEDN
jgi:hypothetical protein